MTKILHITSGTYVKFWSGSEKFRYDKPTVVEYEQSYAYIINTVSIKEYINNILLGHENLTGSGGGIPDTYIESEFEIIYD